MNKHLQIILLAIIAGLLVWVILIIPTAKKQRVVVPVGHEQVLLQGNAHAVANLIGLLASTCACGELLPPPGTTEIE